MSGGHWPSPLRLPGGGHAQEVRAETTATSGVASGAPSGAKAPRGPHKRERVPQQCPSEPAHRCPAVPPFYSGDPALLARVAKAPLSDVDGLLSLLVPGAELATEGVLHQFAEEELVMMAYAIEQIEQAASKRLVKELEVRDELRSVCVHRR